MRPGTAPTALAYCPAARSVTLDRAQRSGPVRAQWFDPTSGRFTPVPGGPFSNDGTRDVTPPGRNAAGDTDWALLLETQA